jgi:drug/metabolite transporter (DMT)-like permease
MFFLPLLTSLFWAISPYFFSIAQEKIGVNQLNIDRLIFASITLFIVVLLCGANYNVSILQYLFLVLSGIFGLICGDYFLFSSYRKIGPRYSMIMMSLAPIFSCIGAALIFNENIGIIGFIGIITTISGIGIVVSKAYNLNKQKTQTHIKPSKLLFGILAALGQALGLLCVKQAYFYGNISGISATFFRISSAGIILLLWLNIIKKYTNPIKVYINDKSALKYVLLGTLFGPVLGVTLSIISLEYVPLSIAQTLFSTSPIFMLPISHFIMKDKVNHRAITGVVITIIGIGILILYN